MEEFAACRGWDLFGDGDGDEGSWEVGETHQLRNQPEK